MKAITRLNKWSNAHTTIFMDVVRVFFGAFLFWKGIQFAGQTEELVQFIQPGDTVAATLLLAHYIAMAHLAGGVLVAFGLLTRIALAAQIPILIGAVVLSAANSETFMLIESSAALLIGCYFTIAGPGKHSVDYNMKMNI